MRSAEERFHSKYKINPETGCWEWTAAKNSRGYGWFGLNYKTLLAHRFSWMIYRGEIPTGMYVCHKCDNPRCVNPEHLFLGTQTDNMRDMGGKGRHKTPLGQHINVGENHPLHKLTEKDVYEIKQLYKTKKYTQKELAKIFKVDQSTISNIINGKRWN